VKAFGTGEEPRASLAIRSTLAQRRLARNPALALGEAYMDGEIEFGDATSSARSISSP